MIIQETDTTTLARLLTLPPPSFSLKHFLHEYFQLSTSLSNLYTSWSSSTHFPSTGTTLSTRLKGVRVLSQNPWETLLSFLASSNNAIPRIFSLSETLRKNFGVKLLTLPNGYSVYSYPKLSHLKNVTVERYRELGFGYRDKFYKKTVEILCEEEGLRNNLKESEYKKVSLRNWGIILHFFPDAISEPILHPSQIASQIDLPKNTTPYTVNEIKSTLEILPGVGSKVAECVALFSCSCPDLVPADTHVLKMALRMNPSLKEVKGVKQNRMASEVVRNEFQGGYAGWAHSVLFVAELPSFKSEGEGEEGGVKSESEGMKEMF